MKRKVKKITIVLPVYNEEKIINKLHEELNGVLKSRREEFEFIESDARVTTWLAREVMSICDGEAAWNNWLDSLRQIEGPIWLTIDVDGLDPAYVPTTGTPVPGGLAYWQVVETIETIGESSGANWLGADINEIVPDENNHVSEFTAAMLATKVVATHLASKLDIERNKSKEVR